MVLIFPAEAAAPAAVAEPQRVRGGEG
jgi:hypothetical protein